jgi:hypothetical protein
MPCDCWVAFSVISTILRKVKHFIFWHRLADNQVRLQRFAPGYNLAKVS